LLQVLGQATETLVREYGCTSLVTSLVSSKTNRICVRKNRICFWIKSYLCLDKSYLQVREISRVDPRELARDTAGTRSYSLFLLDLAERLPDQVRQAVQCSAVQCSAVHYCTR
jgi:hypothetical protein